jgi:hypothetical protein
MTPEAAQSYHPFIPFLHAARFCVLPSAIDVLKAGNSKPHPGTKGRGGGVETDKMLYAFMNLFNVRLTRKEFQEFHTA